MKLAASSLFVMGWFFIAQPNAHADEITVQVVPADPSILDTSTATSTITVQSVENKISDSQNVLNAASQTQGDAIITTIQANVPNTDTQTAVSIATTQEPIKTAVESATAVIQEANSAIQFAQTALQTAVVAQTNADTQTAVVESATATVSNVQQIVDNIQSQVDSQTVVVATDNINVSQAQQTVQTSTIETTTNGITATVYNGTGRSPELPSENATPILTTTVPQIAFNWGNGSVLDGPSERVIIKFEGTITVPEEAVAVKYAVSSDDGSLMYIDGQLAINNWRDQGTSWSPYSPTYNTTTDKQQDFVIWYYENGGGASCTLGWLIWRADGSGYFTTPQANAFGTTKTITDPAAIAALNAAQQTLTNDTAALDTLQQNLTIANGNLTIAQQNLTTEQQNLTISNQNLTIALQTADSLANTAISKVNEAVTAMTNAAQVTSNYYAEQQRIAAEERARIAAENAAKAEAARIAAEQAIADAQAAQEKAAAEAKAAEDARIVAEQAAKEAQSAADKAKADAEIQTAKDAQAKADAAKAEADAKAKAEQDAVLAEQKAKDEAAKATQEAANAKAEADKQKAEADKIASDQAAKEQQAKDAQAKADAQKAADDKAKQDAIGVKPNSPDQLSDTVVKEAPKEVLVAHVQIDKVGIENGGIEFFGTKSAPQVVGEDGKLTPPAPPPGSGLPIPPEAITTKDTFIGQPGGTSFNSPDIAVPVILVPLDGAIAAVPGAEALNQAFVAMSNIGNDMSPVTRKKAKKILVTTIVIGQIAALRRRFGQ